MAWHADVEWTPEADVEGDRDRLPVARRGRLEESAARSIRGSGAVGQQRAWSTSTKAAVLPCHRSGCDVGTALAMAKLRGPLEALLLLYCCEDFSRWPTILQFAVGALRHPHGAEAATDAMHRIMWRRPAMTLEARAKTLCVRKANYAKVRDLAEDMFQRWLGDGAQRFLDALNADA